MAGKQDKPETPMDKGFGLILQVDLAERGGFEPPIQFDPYSGLANRRFRPLSHLSGRHRVPYQIARSGVNTNDSLGVRREAMPAGPTSSTRTSLRSRRGRDRQSTASRVGCHRVKTMSRIREKYSRVGRNLMLNLSVGRIAIYNGKLRKYQFCMLAIMRASLTLTALVPLSLLMTGLGPWEGWRPSMGSVIPRFEPHPLLPNGHWQTIGGHFLPGKGSKLKSHSVDIALPDGDRLRVEDSAPAGLVIRRSVGGAGSWVSRLGAVSLHGEVGDSAGRPGCPGWFG